MHIHRDSTVILDKAGRPAVRHTHEQLLACWVGLVWTPETSLINDAHRSDRLESLGFFWRITSEIGVVLTRLRSESLSQPVGGRLVVAVFCFVLCLGAAGEGERDG